MAFLHGEGCGPAEARRLADKVDPGFHIMERNSWSPPEEHSIYTLLKQGGQRVRWNVHSKLLVACDGEHCTVSIFDGIVPKALHPDIEEALGRVAR